MALIGKLEATSEYNSYRETLENVYYKIVGVFIDTEKSKVRVSVRGFMSEYARHNQGIGVFKRVFYIPIDYFKETLCLKEALIEKSYGYLLTLPEFKDCVDSLEDYTGNVDITEEDVTKQKEDLESLIKSLQI